MMLGKRMSVVVEFVVRLPGQYRQAGAYQVAGCQGYAAVVEVGGEKLSAPVDLGWCAAQRFQRGGADAGCDWLASLEQGDKVRIVGELEAGCKPDKQKPGRQVTFWQLEVEHGKRLGKGELPQRPVGEFS